MSGQETVANRFSSTSKDAHVHHAVQRSDSNDSKHIKDASANRNRNLSVSWFYGGDGEQSRSCESHDDQHGRYRRHSHDHSHDHSQKHEHHSKHQLLQSSTSDHKESHKDAHIHRPVQRSDSNDSKHNQQCSDEARLEANRNRRRVQSSNWTFGGMVEQDTFQKQLPPDHSRRRNKSQISF